MKKPSALHYSIFMIIDISQAMKSGTGGDLKISNVFASLAYKTINLDITHLRELLYTAYHKEEMSEASDANENVVPIVTKKISGILTYLLSMNTDRITIRQRNPRYRSRYKLSLGMLPPIIDI